MKDRLDNTFAQQWADGATRYRKAVFAQSSSAGSTNRRFRDASALAGRDRRIAALEAELASPQS